MKKIIAAAILTTALFIGCASAEEVNLDGATAAPADINHADSIYYTHLDFYNMTSTSDRIIFESFDRFYCMWFDHAPLPEKERNQPYLIATPKK